MNTVVNKWNHRIPTTCSRCNGRRENLSHALIYCPFVAELWDRVLKICNKISPEITTLSEKSILRGDVGSGAKGVLARYVISVGKFAAWKERNSYQFKADSKVVCLNYFKSYVSNRLKLEFLDLKRDDFRTVWCINNALGKVVGSKFTCVL